VQLVKLEW